VAKMLLGRGAALGFVFLCAHAMGQVSGGTLPDFKAPFVGSPLACSQPAIENIRVPRQFGDRAKLKAKLLNILRESLYDDAKGVVNIAREKEIKKLANKLRKSN
jgi:hypothetical protein